MLYSVMSSRAWGEVFKHFRLILIPTATPREISLHDNWFHVIEAIYYRETGRVPDMSRERFYAKYASAVKAYYSWSKSFERHCEISLIEALIERKLPPMEIGVSKLCCSTHGEWIHGLSRLFYNKRWSTAGYPGTVSLWQPKANLAPHLVPAEQAVKRWIYQRIVDVVEPLTPRYGESPEHHIDWEEDERGHNGYNYPLVICSCLLC
jgi:hypothetical protein